MGGGTGVGVGVAVIIGVGTGVSWGTCTWAGPVPTVFTTIGFADGPLPEEPVHPDSAIAVMTIVNRIIILYERAMVYLLKCLQNHYSMYIKGF
jgi:hypothetical protein